MRRWGWMVLLAVTTAHASTQLWEDAGTKTLACKAWTKGSGNLTHKAGFACLSGATGALTGALTNTRGRVVCIFHGYGANGCLTVVGCRLDQVSCQ